MTSTESAVTELVGASGSPAGPVGWLVPIVRRGDRIAVDSRFATGSFDASDMKELADAGQAVPLAPRAMSDAFPGDSAPDVGEASGPEFLRSPRYVLYADEAEWAQIGEDCGIIEILAEFRRTGVEVEACPSRSPTAFRAVRRDALVAFLEAASRLLRPAVFERLHRDADLDDRDPDRFRRSDRAASLLCRLAYDVPSAREAIALRAIPAAHVGRADAYVAWIRMAAAPWGLPTAEDYWRGLARSVGYALAVRSVVSTQFAAPLYSALAAALGRYLSHTPSPFSAGTVLGASASEPFSVADMDRLVATWFETIGPQASQTTGALAKRRPQATQVSKAGAKARSSRKKVAEHQTIGLPGAGGREP